MVRLGPGDHSDEARSQHDQGKQTPHASPLCLRPGVQCRFARQTCLSLGSHLNFSVSDILRLARGTRRPGPGPSRCLPGVFILFQNSVPDQDRLPRGSRRVHRLWAASKLTRGHVLLVQRKARHYTSERWPGKILNPFSSAVSHNLTLWSLAAVAIWRRLGDGLLYSITGYDSEKGKLPSCAVCTLMQIVFI